jgi:hypothetical protein
MTIGVRKSQLLLPKLLNIFLEIIMSDALEHHNGILKIGSRSITKSRFDDDIDEQKKANKTFYEHLDKIQLHIYILEWKAHRKLN